jgi:hypothetical protein
MPELGKATYELVFNTSQVQKMQGAEARVDAATKSIAASVGMADRQLSLFGETSAVVAGEVTAASGEMQGAMEKTAAASTAESDAVAASNAKIGASSRASAGAVAASTGRIRKSFASMAESGRASWKMLGMGLAGVGALTLFGGYKELKLENQGLSAIHAAMQSNKNLAWASVPVLTALAKSYEKNGIESQGAAMGMESLLLRYPMIRNEAGKGNDILNKTVVALREVDAGMQAAGRNVKLPQLAIMFGRALTDPAHGLSALGRAGVRFTVQQQAVIKALVAAHKPLQAQRYMVDAVIKTWKGADKAFGNTIQGKVRATKFAFEQLGKTLLISMLPVLKSLFGYLQRGMNWMRTHPAIIKAVAVAFGILYGSLKLVKMAVAALTVVIEADPLMLLVTAVAALAAAFVLAVKYPKMLEAGLRKLGLSGAQAHMVVMKLQQAFHWLKAEAIKLWPAVKEVLVRVKTLIMDVIGFVRKHWGVFAYYLRTAWHYVVNTIKNDLAFLKSLFQFFIDLITGKWGKLWGDVKGMAMAFWHQLENIFVTGVNLLGPIIYYIVNFFIKMANAVIGVVHDLLQSVINGFTSMYNGLSDALGGVIGHLDVQLGDWSIGFVKWAGLTGAAAGSALGAEFAANAAAGLGAVNNTTAGIIRAERSGKLERADWNGKQWVNHATGKPLTSAQQREATRRWKSRMEPGLSPKSPNYMKHPLKGDSQDITGKAGKKTTTPTIPTIAVGGGGGPTPLPPDAFSGPAKAKKGKKGKGAGSISNDPGYVAQELAVAHARLKGTVAYRLALMKEEDWLKQRLKDSKLSAKKKLAYEKALYAVEKALTAATKKQESDALANEKYRYQIAIAIAERKGLGAGGKNATTIQKRIKQMELDMLQEEEDAVIKALHKKGLSLKAQASLQTQWTSLEKKMSAIQATFTPSVLVFANAPARIKRALAKAARTTTLKDDIAAMEEERKWLEKMVKNKKLSLAMHVRYSDELRRLNLRIEEERRKIIASQASLNASEKELAAAMDVRGTFFAQFAGNIFGGSPGGLTLQPDSKGGGGGKTIKVEQNNEYHVPPPDPHVHAAALRRAATGAMGGL